MKVLRRYFGLWLKLTINSFLTTLTSRLSAGIFLTGKLLRFVFFVVFLLALFTKTPSLANYTITQALFFFLTFNLIDTITQLFFREAYRFRQLVVSGDFDLVLVKPMNPLFRALAGGADPLDLLMLVPFVGLLGYLTSTLNSLSIVRITLYLLLVFNGLLIATGFHILVLALAVVTTEIDHAIMIYRDLTSMGRVPVDIYREPLKSLITFVIPVGIMMTFPAKALMGLLTPFYQGVALLFGVFFFTICLRVWRRAIRSYASASS